MRQYLVRIGQCKCRYCACEIYLSIYLSIYLIYISICLSVYVHDPLPAYIDMRKQRVAMKLQHITKEMLSVM
jgi:hypothetical protein